MAVTFSDIKQTPKWRRFNQEALVEAGQAIPSQDGRDLASVGKPLPGVEISIRSKSGQRLNDGQVGSVWVQSPGVMQGYLDRPEINAEIFDNEGWLDTGDTGFIFDDELHLCGRSKDLIIINGRNHDPALVEDALHGLDGIRPGCISAFALTDDVSGTEGLGLVAETREEDPAKRTALEQEVIARIQETTGIRVSYLRLTKPGTLPRTSSGKIRRQETRKRLLAGQLNGPASAGKGTYIRETLRGFWSHATTYRKTKRSA